MKIVPYQSPVNQIPKQIWLLILFHELKNMTYFLHLFYYYLQFNDKGIRFIVLKAPKRSHDLPLLAGLYTRNMIIDRVEILFSTLISGYRRTLTSKDVWPLRSEYLSRVLIQVYNRIVAKQMGKTKQKKPKAYV